MKPKKCLMCPKPYSNNFYDKSIWRPLCSRSCYSKYINSLPARYEKKLHNNHYKEIKEPKYEYYMRGILTLVNYNL